MDPTHCFINVAPLFFMRQVLGLDKCHIEAKSITSYSSSYFSSPFDMLPLLFVFPDKSFPGAPHPSLFPPHIGFMNERTSIHWNVIGLRYHNGCRHLKILPENLTGKIFTFVTIAIDLERNLGNIS